MSNALPRTMQSLMIVTLAATLTASGCATKAQTGTAVGAGLGGGIGYALGGVPGLLIGGTLGGLGGYATGRAMDEDDRRRAAYALEQNRYMEWQDAQGNYYQMQPTATSYREGRECRNFTMNARIDGRPQNVNGVACRRPDGTWETISG